jgi:hypothetical protein
MIAPGRIRTCDRRFRKPLLYPPELRAQGVEKEAIALTNAPGRIRTCDLRFRKPPLYPPELRARCPATIWLDSPRRGGLLSTTVPRGIDRGSKAGEGVMESETQNTIVISGGRAICCGSVDELAVYGLVIIINDRSDSAERDAARRVTQG